VTSLQPLEEVIAAVLELTDRLGPERRPLVEAAGCVLAEDVVAADPVPPFANTAMDGFAVRSADTGRAGSRLRVVETVAAGSVARRSVGPGEAIRIMTGAPLPAGADTVAMVEITRPVVGSASSEEILVTEAVPPGLHIRAAGSDIAAGSTVLRAGERLTPAHLGVLASVGRSTITVIRRPRVAVLSTGDELVGPDTPLRPGQIRDSNRVALLAAVAAVGAEPVDLGCVQDDEEALRRALDAGADAADLVLTSGGVSVGDFDLTKVVLEAASHHRMRWTQVAIRPAKPFAFGPLGAALVLCLPGNPVSSMVSFECFARPALRKLAGHASVAHPVLLGRTQEPLARSPDGKLHLLRVAVHAGPRGEFSVSSAGAQGSHQALSLARAQALALVPDGPGIPADEDVWLWPLAGSDLAGETTVNTPLVPAPRAPDDDRKGKPGRPKTGC
jgi:molybdopterin molybdotransferase